MKEWLFSTEHKRIGLMYLYGSAAVFLSAGIAAILIRMEQFNPGPGITDNPAVYGKWLYFHGAAMILAFLIPALTGFFGNYFIPLMIGAPDMAFPRANALGLWFYFAAIVLALLTFVIPDSMDLMWTGYPPYSLSENINTSFYVFVVYLLGASAALSGINLITTVYFMRAPGMGLLQMNMLVWGALMASILQLIFAPVLVAAVTLLLSDKYFGTNFFNPANGGDPLLYENLFWFYGHPAVYIIFLPAVGILFEIVSTMAKRQVFNRYTAIFAGMIGTSLMSGDVWVHHLFVSGMPNWIRVGMMVTTLMITIPIGILTICLFGTLYKGRIYMNTAMYYAFASMIFLLIGGLTGIPNAIPSVAEHISKTTFVHAHFHYVMAQFALFAIIGALYFWLPKMTGRLANEKTGKIGFWLNFVGTNATFFPLLIIGTLGMPRRYNDYPMAPELAPYHHIATYGAFLTFIGMAITLYSLVQGARSGEKSKENPWYSKSLEWTCPSPPPLGNFTAPPKVEKDWTPYDYN